MARKKQTPSPEPVLQARTMKESDEGFNMLCHAVLKQFDEDYFSDSDEETYLTMADLTDALAQWLFDSQEHGGFQKLIWAFDAKIWVEVIQSWKDGNYDT